MAYFRLSSVLALKVEQLSSLTKKSPQLVVEEAMAEWIETTGEPLMQTMKNRRLSKSSKILTTKVDTIALDSGKLTSIDASPRFVEIWTAQPLPQQEAVAS